MTNGVRKDGMSRVRRLVIALAPAITLFLNAFFFPAGHALAGEAAAPPAAAAAEAVKEGEGEVSVLETAVQDAEDAVAKGGEEAKPAGETPEQAAARAEAEHKERLEQERKEILARAEHFVEAADETISTKLPYPLNLLFSVRFLGITLWRYLVSAAIAVLGILFTFFVARRFKKAKYPDDPSDEQKESGGSGRWRRAFKVAFISMRNAIKLVLLGILMRMVSTLVVTVYHPEIVWFSSLLVFMGIVLYFFDLVGIVDRVYGDRMFQGNRLMETVRPILLKLIRFVIIFIAGLQIYQGVTGQPMFSLLAGLGIGGLALALASQETLQNLLGFASIALDKAFLVGDAVSIAGYDGTVEHVGLRSMRLRTYNGNSVVIPNNAAINSNLVNLNRRPFIRREIRIALSPLNPYEKIVQAMDGIAEAAAEHDGKLSGLPPVVRFIDYEPARFIIQVYFWYDPEKPFFFDECSKVNLAICKKLSELGVLYAER